MNIHNVRCFPADLYPLATVGAGAFLSKDDEPTACTAARVCISQRGAAGDAGWFPKGIGSSTEFTCQATHAVRKLVRSASAGRCPGNDLPHVFAELQVFDILGQVVQAADQAERVSKRGERCLPEAGRYAEPGLLSELDHDPVCHLLDRDRESGLSTGGRAGMRANLNSHFITFAESLGVKIPTVELG